jgi:hypothetical protein
LESLHDDLRFSLISVPRYKRSDATPRYSNFKPEPSKILILVSGVGTPRNWTHSITRTGNSTHACASLTERFIHALCPDITVVEIHFETNMLRYDKSIVFAQRELLCRAFNPTGCVTLATSRSNSFKTGTPATGGGEGQGVIHLRFF